MSLPENRLLTKRKHKWAITIGPFLDFDVVFFYLVFDVIFHLAFLSGIFYLAFFSLRFYLAFFSLRFNLVFFSSRFNLVLTLNLLDGTAALLGNCELSPNKKEENLKTAVHCRADPPSRSECGENRLELNKGGRIRGNTGGRFYQAAQSSCTAGVLQSRQPFFFHIFLKTIVTNKSLICIWRYFWNLVF